MFTFKLDLHVYSKNSQSTENCHKKKYDISFNLMEIVRVVKEN